MRYGLTFHRGPAAERIRMTGGVRPDASGIMCAASNSPQCRMGRELVSGSPSDIPFELRRTSIVQWFAGVDRQLRRERPLIGGRASPRAT